MRMEIKRNYHTGEPDTLIRGNHARKIYIPARGIQYAPGHHVKPVFIDNSPVNEDGRLDVLQPAIATAATLFSYARGEEIALQTKVLQGEAHFVALTPEGRLEHSIIGDGRFNIPEPEPFFVKGLIYTWLGGKVDTTILTLSRPGFKNNPPIRINPLADQISNHPIPSGYWHYLEDLKKFLAKR